MTYSLAKHKARPIRFLELWEENGWKVKIYGISQNTGRPDESYMEISKEIARQLLPQPPVTASRYGMAFITIT